MVEFRVSLIRTYRHQMRVNDQLHALATVTLWIRYIVWMGPISGFYVTPLPGIEHLLNKFL